jgi:putative phosphoribosyl transferase
LLAPKLVEYANRKDVIVLGLPRGGIPVAFEVARRLNLPLDVFVVRKLGVPGRRELAMGALATGGVRILNEELIAELGLSELTIDAVAEQEQKELARREIIYRGSNPSPRIKGKAVILVDDGIATGSSMRAAVEAVRRQKPARVIVATPTAAASSYRWLKRYADEVVALIAPEDFLAVGEFYESFPQTSDEEVKDLLTESDSRIQMAEFEGQEAVNY